MPDDMYDVFLCHSSADKPAVEEVARRLQAGGVRPWLDKWNLVPGEPWQPEIENALRFCRTCAVFVGDHLAHPWQNEEMRAAIARRVADAGKRFRVIPVLLPKARRTTIQALPSFLVAATWVEFRRLRDTEALHCLI